MKQTKKNLIHTIAMLGGIGLMTITYSCTTSSGSTEIRPQLPSLPVITVSHMATTTYNDYPATLEGKVNVEIRPQVDGYLEQIYVDEGAFVKAGQLLFRINDRPYREQLANANASLNAALANQEKAQLEVDKLAPLVKNNVVSDIQLKTAQAGLQTARANVSQARAMVSNAEINAGYALIKAPVNGYIGRIPHKIGSLVGRGESLPLTVLSDVNEVYAYFSMSEVDFLHFKEQVPGNTLEDKIKNLPPVDLILPDGALYPAKGKIVTIEGQFDKTMGTITFRATFPNNAGLLRSGNSGRVRIPRNHNNVLVVPQQSTFELQDKVLVFVVADSNKVVSRPISVSGKNDNYYFVGKGLELGEKIIYTGLSRLRDGMEIHPDMVSLDSLYKVKPI
ncbi:MAG TPA: efflux RND transporter periplasmic adaptor subunit [Ohtaekwangia sp.]|nr:efflux RND transporter periplasmic adaptor subunit [Ohtaekwangia sp.]